MIKKKHHAIAGIKKVPTNEIKKKESTPRNETNSAATTTNTSPTTNMIPPANAKTKTSTTTVDEPNEEQAPKHEKTTAQAPTNDNASKTKKKAQKGSVPDTLDETMAKPLNESDTTTKHENEGLLADHNDAPDGGDARSPMTRFITSFVARIDLGENLDTIKMKMQEPTEGSTTNMTTVIRCRNAAPENASNFLVRPRGSSTRNIASPSGPKCRTTARSPRLH